MNKKNQHFVPTSYLKAWCELETPKGQEPAVWIHSSDGTSSKRKAPKKVLKEIDFYTISESDGTRNLYLEDQLGKIETDYPRIRDELISSRQFPNSKNLATLCMYATLMMVRTKSIRNTFQGHWKKVHENIKKLEILHDLPRKASLDTKKMVEIAPNFFTIRSVIKILTHLQQMNLTLVFSESGPGFITSDTPAYLYNPKSYQMPPFYRSPGFLQEDVEFRFPLSPEIMFIASWLGPEGVFPLGDDDVQDLNRVTRFKCNEFFITQSQEINPFWFNPGKEPDDSWERMQETAEGQE